MITCNQSITKYELIEGGTIQKFNENVTKALLQGASLHGTPYYDGVSHCQAVIYQKTHPNLGPM